jgi:Regulator of ribonuclease activity B
VPQVDAEYEYTPLGRFDPADPEDPDGDAATLAALAAQGANMAEPTEFIHYLRFQDENHARAAAQALAEQLGYNCTGFEPDAAVPYWCVRAETERVPTLENVRRMRQVMQVAAERFDAEYDGWEAAVRR